MKLFSIIDTASKKPPAAPIPQPKNPERVLLDRLHEIDAELGALSKEMREFKKNNMAVIDGHIVYLAASLTARKTLDTQWGEHSKRFSKLLVERNDVLAKWSKEKNVQ